jgi:hypothetical protein
MEASERGALFLVRFVAAALIGWTLVELGMYALDLHVNNLPLKVLPCFIRCIPLIIGVTMLIKARALAEWVADTLDL